MLYKVGQSYLTVHDQIDMKNFDIHLTEILLNHFNICPKQEHKIYITKFRTVLKQPQKFEKLLNLLKLDHETFLQNVIKLYPEVFSSHLIGIIKKIYLN
jgi:hypothetical protein